MRLDGFEIKVTIGADQVAEARAEWLSGGEARRRSIWFLEQPAPRGRRVALPLFRAGVILRLRENQRGKDDATVKLRPCDPSWLGDPWLDAKDDGDRVVKVEQDWAGDRHVLAASLRAELGKGKVAALGDGGLPVRALFSDRQERFLEECAPVPVDLGAVRPFGPVDVLRWEDVEVGPHEAVAEQWQVGSLLFLELSIRVDGTDAAKALRRQTDFEWRVRDRGIKVDEGQTKTGAVLEYLASRTP